MQKGEGTRTRLWAVCGLRSDQEGHGGGPGLAPGPVTCAAHGPGA